mgnify:CR=1 FL=1
MNFIVITIVIRAGLNILVIIVIRAGLNVAIILVIRVRLNVVTIMLTWGSKYSYNDHGYDDGYKLVDIETAKMKSFDYDEDKTWNTFKYRDKYVNKELPVSPLQNRVVINENTNEPPLTVYIELNSVVADLYNYKNEMISQFHKHKKPLS